MLPFVHLHVHSEFSILDSPSSSLELCIRAKELGFKEIAITDHGSMCGAVRFQQDADAVGIKPIYGLEFYVSNYDLDKETSIKPEDRRSNYFHLLLLAKNNSGLNSLTRLASKSSINGFYYRPRIDFKILAENSHDLICTTACVGGPIGEAIQRNDTALAIRRVKGLKKIFGDDLYIEIQINELPIQKNINSIAKSIAKKYDLKILLASDVHYALPEDNEAQDAMVLMKRGKTWEQGKNEVFTTRELYMKTPDDILKDWKKWNYEDLQYHEIIEYMENTHKVASMCNSRFSTDDYLLPTFDTSGENIDEFFLKKVKKCFGELHIDTKDLPLYLDQLKKEISVIKKRNLTNYFLIISDMIDFAKRNNIGVGPGRGSVGGSLIAYILGITQIDPLRFGLSFDRFLTIERKDLPDIDLDFCDWGRQLIISYLMSKYGETKVLPIISFSTFGAKGTLRDLGKLYGIPTDQVEAISSQINEHAIQKESILDTIKDVSPFKEFFARYPEILRVGIKIEGKVRHMSRHAAGVVITPQGYDDLVPVVKSGDMLHCGFDYDPKYLSLDYLKLLKVDILGLSTLSVIEEAKRIIAENGKEIDWDWIWELDDSRTYRSFREGLTEGVFQMESWGYKKMIQEISPTNFNHLIIAVALYRPTTLAAKLDKVYYENKKKNYTHPNPIVGEVLNSTNGTLIFQEQVISLSSKLGGLSLGEADSIRKALTKFQSTKLADFKGNKLIEEFHKKFIKGSVENGMPQTEAENLFETIKKFSLYAFNRAHATGYAIISYITMFLKVHYPLEYMLALLIHTSPGEENRSGKMKIMNYINEAKRMGIKILPPDINKGKVNFSIEGNNIRAGLGIVKWVGEAFAKEIIDARPLNSLEEFIEKLGHLNARGLKSLIASRAFDSKIFGDAITIYNRLNKVKKFTSDENDIGHKESIFGIDFDRL